MKIKDDSLEQMSKLIPTLTKRAQTQKRQWTGVPKRARTTCRKVRAPGAFVFNSTVIGAIKVMATHAAIPVKYAPPTPF